MHCARFCAILSPSLYAKPTTAVAGGGEGGIFGVAVTEAPQLAVVETSGGQDGDPEAESVGVGKGGRSREK